MNPSALLGDYLDVFSNTYQERMEDDDKVSTDVILPVGETPDRFTILQRS